MLHAAWLTINRYGDKVATAHAPWSYLWSCVRQALVSDAIGHACLSTSAARAYADRCDARPVVDRTSDDMDRLVAPATRPAAGPSLARLRLIQIIIDAGGRPALWTDAVEHALDVMADARRSYQECVLRRDPYLLNTLGLLPYEVSALAALLIGARRGDRRRESPLLALTRDLARSPCDVPRACERLTILLARPHTRWGGGPSDNSEVARSSHRVVRDLGSPTSKRPHERQGLQRMKRPDRTAKEQPTIGSELDCPRLWNVHDVAQFLGVPIATLHQWRYLGTGPDAFRVGKHLRYDPAAVRAWLRTDCARQRPA